ncbi:MAG: tetratricopeptide repeat protein [Candidatus Cryptobacteroides sp.]
MKRLIIIVFALSGVFSASAQPLKEYMTEPLEWSLFQNGGLMDVDLTVSLGSLDVRNNSLVTLTPLIVNDKDTVSLSTVGFYGRRRWFYYERNEKHIPDGFKESSLRENDMPDQWTWCESVPYSSWMNGAELELLRQVYGCCNDIKYQDIVKVGGYTQYVPRFIFIAPMVEKTKSRHIEGRAYVDFPVSQTVIYPDYRNNRVELAKITATIDTLKSDGDIDIKSVTIKGFASPESPYENNTMLARGRTRALKEYVSELYHFPDNFILTSYEPENWEGLREYVLASSISHKQEILDIIDITDRDPDTKEWILKSRYPSEYKFLLANCYPALRRSDYMIEYTIRGYSDVDEIERVFQRSPGKLSLHELYLLSSKYPEGSPEYERVFDVAVTLYPDDEVANLNAASAELKAGRYDRVERYLSKAGDSAEADYMRGVWAYLSGDDNNALVFFRKSADAGYAVAKEALEVMAGR